MLKALWNSMLLLSLFTAYYHPTGIIITSITLILVQLEPVYAVEATYTVSLRNDVCMV